MGLLFVLIIWGFILAIAALFLGIIGALLGFLFHKWKDKKVRYWAWFITPGTVLISFAVLFFIENVAYGIVTDSDIGIGDYGSVNINDKYHLYWIDIPDWSLDTRANNNAFSGNETFSHIQEILVHNDTIAFTAEIHKHENDSIYYVLTQLDANKERYVTIDSASTTAILWDRYTQARNLDKGDICTCDQFYLKQRIFFTIGILLFNLIIYILFFYKFGKRLLLKK